MGKFLIKQALPRSVKCGKQVFLERKVALRDDIMHQQTFNDNLP